MELPGESCRDGYFKVNRTCREWWRLKTASAETPGLTASLFAVAAFSWANDNTRMLRTNLPLCIGLLLQAAIVFSAESQTPMKGRADVMSLAGRWEFQLDPEDKGTTGNWAMAALPDSVKLPGSTDENGKGNAPEEKRTDRLSRVHSYVGPAWYSKEVTVPKSWAGQHIVLFLERCHWVTSLWVDGKPFGSQNSLCVPHEYDVTNGLQPGKHRLTLRVDNSMKIDIGNMSHSITDHSQTNWNGIVGLIELRAQSPAWIESVAFYPDVATSTVKTRVTIGSRVEHAVQGTVMFSAKPDVFAADLRPAEFEASPGEQTIEYRLPLRKDAKLWDEFSPARFQFMTTMLASDDGRTYTSTHTEMAGLRDFRAKGKRFEMNGRSLSLRGTLECCVFPRTGYPPMDIEAWRRVLHIAKDYGLNHMRFHSWCPPEAAFQAADELGVMFQVESPIWTTDGRTMQNPSRAAFYGAETDRIVDTYGNHASFCLMSMGNELLVRRKGDEPFLVQLVTHLQQKDPRHLYTCSTAPYGQERADDYFVTHSMPKGMVRGQKRIGLIDASTDFDWDDRLDETTRPVLSHEIGQYAMYPNFREIEKYTGVLRANNFAAFRDTLTSTGLGRQADDFVQASGQLIVRLYKDEIEAMLRSRNSAGFQLLDLHDFPGQGTSLVGILDAFWDSKGLIKPAEFRRFCAPAVPLLRMEKREWSTTETFKATVELSYFGPKDLPHCRAVWAVRDASGRELISGKMPVLDVPTGKVTRLGDIQVSLKSVDKAQKLTVAVKIDQMNASNTWDIWVFPSEPATSTTGVFVSHVWDRQTKDALAQHKTVLLYPQVASLADCVQGRFCTVFWNARMFKQPETMGIFCDPNHPALAGFPTSFHSDWQWLDLIQHSTALVLDSTTASFRPIVQAVPDFNANRKLGYMFEASVGGGRLFVSGIDLDGDLAGRPAACQLRNSILSYVASSRFRPKMPLSAQQVDAIVRPSH